MEEILHPYLSVCSFLLSRSKTQIFGYFWYLLLFLNAFFKAQIWQNAEEYAPSRFVSTALHKSLLQTKSVEYILHVNFQ
jgi:hypothetical protein